MTSNIAARARLASRPSAASLLGAALAAIAFVATLVVIWHGGVFPSHPGSGRLDATGVVLVACSALPLLAWQRLGVGVFALTAGFGVVLAVLGYPADVLLGATAALYLIAAHRRREWTSGTAVLVVGMFAVYLIAAGLSQGTFPTSAMLHTGLAWAAAWFAGERTRLSRQHIADLRQRALRAERESERERLLATVEERARIARDLHDSAGHAISVIAVRAGAARLRGDPEHSRQALEAVEVLARQTVAEIDQLVSGLRDNGGPVEAPAGMASLDTLVARHTEAGLDIELAMRGQPRPLRAVADQASYRILQEALTNAARHGSGTARIDVDWHGDHIAFTVTNPVANATAERTGGGHGLIGMRERASLAGGNVEAGAQNGGFEVRATIPYGGQGR